MKKVILFINTFFFIIAFMVISVLPVEAAIHEDKRIDIELTHENNKAEDELNLEATLVDSLTFSSNNIMGYCTIKLVSDNTNENTISVDKAFITYYQGQYTFEIGKNRTLKGVGYAWNPSDILNLQKSPLYREDEKRGVEEATYLVSLNKFADLTDISYEITGMLIPSDKMDDLKYIFSLKRTTIGFESYFIAGFQPKAKEDKEIYGGYFRSDLPWSDGITYYGEFQSVEFEQPKYLVGMQITPKLFNLRDRLQLQVEYFYNSHGYESMEDYWNENPTGIPVLGETLTRYGYIGLAYTDINLRASMGLMMNIENDKSGLANYFLSWFPTREAMITIGGYKCFYKEDSCEFSSLLETESEIYIKFTLFN